MGIIMWLYQTHWFIITHVSNEGMINYSFKKDRLSALTKIAYSRLQDF